LHILPALPLQIRLHPSNAQVMGRAVVPGTALLEAAAAAARLLLPAERGADAALVASVSIVAPLMLGAQVPALLSWGHCTASTCAGQMSVAALCQRGCHTARPTDGQLSALGYQCCGNSHTVPHGIAAWQYCADERAGPTALSSSLAPLCFSHTLEPSVVC
jgi:hypothetical protein